MDLRKIHWATINVYFVFNVLIFLFLVSFLYLNLGFSNYEVYYTVLVIASLIGYYVGKYSITRAFGYKLHEVKETPKKKVSKKKNSSKKATKKEVVKKTSVKKPTKKKSSKKK